MTWGWPPAIYGTEDKSAAQAALEILGIEVTKKPCLGRLVERGANGFRNMITFLLAPPVAKALAGAGYSKQKIREYVYEHARVPYRELEFLIEYGHSEAFKIPDMVERGLYPAEYLVKPDELVRVLPSPDVINIVVCGDPDRNRVMVLWGGYVSPVTKKIAMPGATERARRAIRCQRTPRVFRGICLAAAAMGLAFAAAGAAERPVVTGFSAPPVPRCVLLDRPRIQGPCRARSRRGRRHRPLEPRPGRAAQLARRSAARHAAACREGLGGRARAAQRALRRQLDREGSPCGDLVDEVAKAKKAGYRRVLVAGQSVGAGTALGASAQSNQIDGVIAFALSHGRGSCRDPNTFRPEMVRFHEEMIRTGIAQSLALRILISMGKEDNSVGVTFTPLVAAALAQKNAAYIHFDESMRQTGHGAAVCAQFASTYGGCVVAFFDRDAAPPRGRHVCAPAD